jgi:hypothetical protein
MAWVVAVSSRCPSLWGFAGTMLALYDKPEAVHELLDYFCDYDCWLADNILTYHDLGVMHAA